MSMDLNLLPSQAKFQAARIKVKSKVNKIMIVMASVWVLGLAIVFVLWFWTKIALAAGEKKYKQAATEFQGISDVILNSEQLKYRAKIVGEILNQRFEYGKAFQTVTSVFPPTISLEDYELKTKKIFSISGIIKDWRAVDDLEKIIFEINSGLTENFKSAELESLSYNVTKGWIFSMEVIIE